MFKRFQYHKYLWIYLFLLLLLFQVPPTAANMELKVPYLAKWYNNKAAAISLRFDDASDTHVQKVVPILNRYDFKATFMINPGRRVYKNYKDFWEHQIPSMGHRLGNHTWSHKGAKSLEEADREIGSVSKLIWALYPSFSKLNVFASGGGEQWAGTSWENAPPDFKQLLSKYSLIDLYDGNHRSKSGRSDVEADDLCVLVEKAIASGTHQAFSFHRIGSYDLYDYIRKIIGRDIYTFSLDKFREFMSCLNERKENVWIAPLVQIYKYEFEYQKSSLEVVETGNDSLVLTLKIDSDDSLYDQPLTLVVERTNSKIEAYQSIDDKKISLSAKFAQNQYLIDIYPQNSHILLFFKPE